MRCKNCANLFNKASYAPRVLGCGHTLCHFCISTILNYGEIVCTFCDYRHKANGLTDIPFNHSVLEELKEENPTEREDLCAIHKSAVNGFCSKCKEFVCSRCFEDWHLVSFGCVKDTMEKGFESLSSGSKVEHLSELIEVYSKNLVKAKGKVEEATIVETAFVECLWSVTKDKRNLESYCEKLESNLAKMSLFKKTLSNCKSLQQFKEWDSKLSSLTQVTLEAAEDATPDLLPSSANLWSNLPVVIYAFRETMGRNNQIFVTTKEKGVCYPITKKQKNIWISSPIPESSIPQKSLSVEMTPAFESFAFKNQKEIALGFGSISTLDRAANVKTSVKAEINLSEDIPEYLYENFLKFCLDGKASQYVCDINLNFIYIHKLRVGLGMHLYFHDNNQWVDKTAIKINKEVDPEKYCLILQQDRHRLANFRSLWTLGKLDAVEGCPVLAMKHNNDVHFVIMKVPISHASKNFEVIGHCKEGVVGEFVGINQTSWHIEMKLM